MTQLYGTGTFDAMAVKDAFLQKVFATMRKGWAGFRCDGMASAVAPKDWRNYQTYEAEITRNMNLQSKTTALCSYDLSKLSSEDVVEIVSTHQASIMKRNGSWVALQSVEHMSSKESRIKEKEFRELADTMPQLAWMANSNGYIYWYNRRWHEYTGIAVDQAHEDGWRAAYDPNDLPKLVQTWQQSIETGTPFEMILSLRSADGTSLPFLMRAMPLHDQNGKINRWFGTCTDLSELTPLLRQAAEQA